MTTELCFLLDLLLNHKLTSATKVLISERIRWVESQLAPISPTKAAPSLSNPQQCASTQALLSKYPDLAPPVVAVTPIAQQALTSREKALAEGLSGKSEDKNRTSPRKF